ncbi:hypothetical protein ACVWWP_007861 [Bradyrhizobium sp. LM3.6]
MKPTTAVTAITIDAAASPRGTFRSSRKVAAGDSIVPVTNAITTGRKNAFPT